MTADEMADALFDAIAERRLYVIPHRKINSAIQAHMEDIMQERIPSSPN